MSSRCDIRSDVRKLPRLPTCLFLNSVGMTDGGPLSRFVPALELVSDTSRLGSEIRCAISSFNATVTPHQNDVRFIAILTSFLVDACIYPVNHSSPDRDIALICKKLCSPAWCFNLKRFRERGNIGPSRVKSHGIVESTLQIQEYVSLSYATKVHYSKAVFLDKKYQPGLIFSNS